ncbi:MAG: primosomal replication protein N [Betaproteobacteria bacterium]|nr:primosomal replication protein N [Betaproteobacteria bacterium]
MSRNALVLDGVIAEIGALRRTPAGVAVLEFQLEHASRQIEAGIERDVRCEVPALVLGDIALQSQALRPGKQVTLTGFLAARSARHKGLVMHVNTIEILEGN